MVVSHDRWFLDRLATHILAFEDEGHVEWFAGNSQDYEADKCRRLGPEAIEPHRLRYRPITRQPNNPAPSKAQGTLSPEPLPGPEALDPIPEGETALDTVPLTQFGAGV